MDAENKLDFIHRFVPGTTRHTLLLLHGTGGNEDDLLSLGSALDPEAALLSPRGKVLENGMPRFFRRRAEGVFDEADLIRRAHELADFVEAAVVQYERDPDKIIAVGYSNGANIAGALLLLRPGLLSAAALLRAMVPLVPPTLPKLPDTPVLLLAGAHDPIIPASHARELASLLERAGAMVTSQVENAGHGLTSETVDQAQRWLAAQVHSG